MSNGMTITKKNFGYFC